MFTWNNPPWSYSFSECTGGVLLAGIENAVVLKLSVDSMITWKQAESPQHFRLQVQVAGKIRARYNCKLNAPSWNAHLWAGGVRRAPGSLAPGATLAAQLLRAMLSHPLQQQVVDSREMVVAAALQRLGKRTESRLVFLPPCLNAVALNAGWYANLPLVIAFLSLPCFLFFKWKPGLSRSSYPI